MANDLQTIDQTNSSTPWSEPRLPERLATLVDRSDLPKSISLDASEVVAIERALAVYGEAPSISTPRQINKMMAKLSLAYPGLKLSEAEAGARLELYGENLCDIPIDILGEGFRAAVRTCKFFPSVSELRDLALRQPATPRMIRQHRLRMMLEAHQTASAEAPKEIATPAQIAEIKREMGLTEETAAMLDRIVGSEAA